MNIDNSAISLQRPSNTMFDTYEVIVIASDPDLSMIKKYCQELNIQINLESPNKLKKVNKSKIWNFPKIDRN